MLDRCWIVFFPIKTNVILTFWGAGSVLDRCRIGAESRFSIKNHVILTFWGGADRFWSVRVGPWVQIHILAMRNLCATYAHPMRNTSRIRREIRLLTLKGHCSRHSQRICMIKNEDCAKFPALSFSTIKT